MKCYNCGYDKIKPSQKVCPCCGISLTTVVSPPEPESKQEQQQRECPECHRLLADDINFCPYCGHSFLKSESTPVPPAVSVSTPEPVSQPELPSEPPFGASAFYGPSPVYEPEPEPQPETEQPVLTAPAAGWRAVPKRHRGSFRELNYDSPDEGTPEPPARQESETEPVGTYDRRSGEMVYEYEKEDSPNVSTIDLDQESVPDSPSSSFSWLIMAVIAIASFLVGALLYFLTQS